MVTATTAQVEFCGEVYPIQPGEPLVIGRDGRLNIDENPYLHRAFLQISDHESLWWIANVGSFLAATIADEPGTLQAWLAPGGRLPLLFERSVVWFTAGSTTYEFDVVLSDPPFASLPGEVAPAKVGPSPDDVLSPAESAHVTVGRMLFTADQKRLILALCEPMLRRGIRGAGSVPTSADAAARLGWPLTRFNRKLDNVCDKLARSGIRGLHGEPGRLAVNRRARLIEYALAARLVQRADLDLLDRPRPNGSPTDKDDDE